MKQYTLTNWTMENHQSIFGSFVLRGFIQGHPTIPDGTEVRTTAVTSMDNEAGVAYTHHSGAYSISTATMSDDWKQQVVGGNPADPGDGSSFLQDSLEQGPFDDVTQDSTDDSSADDSTDALGVGTDADLGGLPPGLLALLQGLGDDGQPDDALQGDKSLQDA